MADSPVTPVAVIGMACRLPGGIDSPDRLWEALLRGDDLITEIPTERWDAESIYDPEPGVPGRSVTKWGAFLDDVAGFDPEFFGIADREATAIDPQHRLLLETSWEAVEHAGVNPATLAGSRTGVFVGLAHDDYHFVTGRAPGPWRDRTDTPAPTSAWRRDASLTPWACTVPRSRWTPRARLACSPCTWPAAACTTAKATWRWRVALR